MKIKNVNARMSVVTMAVVTFFAIILVISFLLTGDLYLLAWGIPTLVLLALIPLALNYMSQKEYADMVPMYEAEARPVRIKLINKNMIGQPVRVEGVVEQVHFKFLNRPQYRVADRSGEISVKMFTTPAEDIKVGDVVEVLGQVIRRYIVSGDAAINCISIRKISKVIETKKKVQGEK
jgi:RecJ-like exonuclease